LGFVPAKKLGEGGEKPHRLIYVQRFMAKILHTLSDKWATEKVTSGVISGTQIER
jgi:hypothetical protein